MGAARERPDQRGAGGPGRLGRAGQRLTSLPGALPAGLGLDESVAEVRRRLTLPDGASLILAVSGGPDSAALALLVQRARPDLRLAVVHIRHGLRDDAPDASAAAAIARRLGLPLVESQVKVERGGEGLEAAARAARYRELARVAEQIGAHAVAVGHNADDQAETVLLALGRGSGIRGLSGMREERLVAGGSVMILRPLLRLRRADLRALAADLPTVTDPTNVDLQQRRARVRQGVLPALAGLAGDRGDPVAVLTRLADLARADADLLDELAAAHAVRLVGTWGVVRIVRAAELDALPAALARRVVRSMLAAVRGGLEGLDAAAVARVLGLVSGEVHVSGGIRVSANAGWLAAAPPGLAALRERLLTPPRSIVLDEIGVGMCAGEPPRPDASALPPRARTPGGPAGGALARLPAGDDLVVRAARPGDRVPGSTRGLLGDRFTDLGVPRLLRPLVPVVARQDGEVVWVPGVAAPAVSGPLPVWVTRQPPYTPVRR